MTDTRSIEAARGCQAEGALCAARRPRVLLVDDQAAIVTVTSRVLDYHGYNVTPFTSSREALERYIEQPDRFDVALLDRNMPDVDGPELATRLWRCRPEFPVVFMSALEGDVPFPPGTHAGPHTHLVKPYETDQLVQALDTLTRRPR